MAASFGCAGRNSVRCWHCCAMLAAWCLPSIWLRRCSGAHRRRAGSRQLADAQIRPICTSHPSQSGARQAAHSRQYAVAPHGQLWFAGLCLSRWTPRLSRFPKAEVADSAEVIDLHRSQEASLWRALGSSSGSCNVDAHLSLVGRPHAGVHGTAPSTRTGRTGWPLPTRPGLG